MIQPMMRIKLGVQLGCNGIVYILFEPIKNDDANNPVNLLKKFAQQRKDTVLVTVFNEDKNAVQKGTRCFINEKEIIYADEFAKAFTEKSKQVLQQKQSVIINEGTDFVLYQFIQPAIQLVIVGAGNDAQPLTNMASLLGWNIIVVDGRPTYATQQRFAKANKLSITKPAEILSVVKMDEQTAVVLMTHNYNYDVAALEKLINTNCKYIGVLGPKKKLNKMIDELKENEIMVGDEKMQNIYGPVGLDIGAETSEEIALSIIAEIKAVFSERARRIH